eukprot:Phypoly_transcript_07332.p1 GENE.Phypoly_transcript_07332~~Phypoly_transcript_07332.p1  ORF type:complete len:356 (+),score=57.80 Phypoly_transcript_07332:146-1213(+)
MPNTPLIMVKPSAAADSNNPPLVSPTTYKQIWNDTGAKGDHSGSFWLPTPPAGYVALGSVCVGGHTMPSTDLIYVVRKDLAMQGLPGAYIWDDNHSHADGNVRVHQIDVNPSLSQDAAGQKMAIKCGTFLAFAPNDDYPGPGVTPETNVLWIIIPSSDNGSDPSYVPVLTNYDIPQEDSKVFISKSAYIPFFGVTDDAGTGTGNDWKVQNTPFYELCRESVWHPELPQNNATNGTAINLSEEVEFGVSQSVTDSFEASTSLEVSATTGIEVGHLTNEVTTNLTKAVGYSSSSNVSDFASKTDTVQYTVDPYHSGCYYLRVDTITLIRGNGTAVPTASISFPTTEHTASSYPNDTK